MAFAPWLDYFRKPTKYCMKTTAFKSIVYSVLFCSILGILGSCAEKETPVVVEVTDVTLSADVLNMTVGQILPLSATVSPSNASNKKVIWSSSDDSVASVDDGKVTALKKGSTTVTVKTDDGGKTASCEVLVSLSGQMTSISLEKVTASTATFKGHIDAGEEELASSRITLYYSDAETFDRNMAEYVSISTFDENHDFAISLNKLKYGTKYRYFMSAMVNDEMENSNLEEFVTSEPVISYNVDVTANTAVFTGTVDDYFIEDRENIEIGFIFSMADDQVAGGNGQKMKVTDWQEDGSFSLELTYLEYGEEYHCSDYVAQGGTADKIGSVQSFKLPNPYSQDLDVSAAEDLSASGTANCYIVSKAGTYKFKAVKGNSNESVGAVSSCRVLWETFGTDTAPQLTDLVMGVVYRDGYIVFSTNTQYRKGNASIAAKDADGKILWSWHIWFTDSPAAQNYRNNAGTMMDRNLGATSAKWGDLGTIGLMYQWGRKDPFFGASQRTGNIEAAATAKLQTANSGSDSNVGTIAYATEHPTTFITNYRYDWLVGSSARESTRWQSKKTIYDPCPAGWRVPDGGRDGVWAKAFGNGLEYWDDGWDDDVRGMDFIATSYPLASGYDSVWYPAAGFRYNQTGKLNYVGFWCISWSVTVESGLPLVLHFENYNRYVYPYYNMNNGFATGATVRCCKE